MVEDDRLRIKRKDFDRANEDFSVSSPARKIRRLDVDLPPITEDVAMQEEDECAPTVTEERAIVLFKPPQSHSRQLFADRDLIAAFKNRLVRDALIAANDNHDEDEKCQALVCWNPSQSPSYSQSIATFQQQPRALEISEVDETAMDIEEEDNKSTCQQQEESTYGFGLHQWQQQQQQHCIIPQLPQASGLRSALYLLKSLGDYAESEWMFKK